VISFKSAILKLRGAVSLIPRLDEKLNEVKINQGLLLEEMNKTRASDNIRDFEYKVFSQGGEDGIIQHLIRTIGLEHRTFIEFGVEDFSESNCRYLLMKDNWSGFVIDGSAVHINRLKTSSLYYKYDINAVNAFITRDNINDLLARSGFGEQLGILSIDIDGNDYWVWEAIDKVSPAVTIVEYNFRFGPSRAVTVPYKPDFVRRKEHYSTIYYGASLAALSLLGKRKGYSLVGCNSAGNNAFFVRRELMPSRLRELTPEQAFVCAKFRESRKEDGTLSYLTTEQEAAILTKLPLIAIV
jgi:hypothetical protein